MAGLDPATQRGVFTPYLEASIRARTRAYWVAASGAAMVIFT